MISGCTTSRPETLSERGPLVVLLHGFPEFWYAWRQQIGPLAAARFRVVAPEAERVTQLLTDFFAPALPAKD